MIEVRAAGPSDIEAALPMVLEYHRFEGIEQVEELARDALTPLLEDSNHGCIWLIHADGEVVGYLAVCFGYSIELGGRDACIDEMFVLEGHRGRGIGSAAIEQVMQLLIPFNVRAVHLEVAHTNERARRAYQAWGFEPRQRYFLMTRSVQFE